MGESSQKLGHLVTVDIEREQETEIRAKRWYLSFKPG